jgi:hypothetical protein
MRSRRWFPAKFSGQLNLENLTKLHIPNRDPQAYISKAIYDIYVGDKVSQLLLEFQMIYDPYLLKRW